ncbi:hypothetical protein J2S59_000603 [Nocardioides massiliensis]|uniref:Uncharacterized protein n=1 Tax=Nocardioides massiliensis TaxID=1325935 RepID=A0ABT9NK50_9ACTN|nr:hypothetical protein [Nocardioides massiliensis]
MVVAGEAAPAGGGVDASAESVQLGKRYFDENTGLEVLCSKGGAGPLMVDGRLLQVRGAKALPSSD